LGFSQLAPALHLAYSALAQSDLPANVAFLACLVCLAEAKLQTSHFGVLQQIHLDFFRGEKVRRLNSIRIFEPAQSNFGKSESD